MTPRRLLPIVALCAALCAPACRAASADGTRWLEPAPAPALAGTSVRGGGAASLAGLRGRVVMLAFGYTRCADVCPVTLRAVQGALRALGPDAREVAPVYVTIDPARDTPERMRDFLQPYDRRIDAWIVPDAALAEARRRYGVSAARRPVGLRRYVGQEMPAADDYALEHAGGVWVVDRLGRLRAQHAHGAPAEGIAAAVRALLAEPRSDVRGP